MVFLSICSAIYDYAPQGDNELALQEGELVYVLEKSAEDDWWKAKKRAASEDEEEPVGLIPNNYVEEVGTREYYFGNTTHLVARMHTPLKVKPSYSERRH